MAKNPQYMTYKEVQAYLKKEVGPIKMQVSDMENGFARLFARMENGFTEIKSQLETKADKSEFNRLYNLVDSYIKRKDDEEQERIAMKSQLNRHERWHYQIARKLGVQLKY